MNALTTENIIRIGKRNTESLHPTTIAYIKELLTPYAEMLVNKITTMEVLRKWVLSFPDKKKRHYLYSRLGSEETPEALSRAKNFIIESIIDDILLFSGGVAIDANDNVILPWDVQKAISDDEDLSKLFAIAKNDIRLPVTFTEEIPRRTYSTEEFITGLVLFSTLHVSNVNITMFGVPINSANLFELGRRPARLRTLKEFCCGWEQGSHLVVRSLNKRFSVEISEEIYRFNTLDFMKGFRYGATSAEVNDRDYWKNLCEYSMNIEEKIIATPIIDFK